VNLKTTKYIRKPFAVEAVKVTSSNIEEVAKWCGGKLISAEQNGKTTVRIDVPLKKTVARDRPSGMAYPGMWVLKSDDRFSVYSQKNLDLMFEPAIEVQTDSRDEVVKEALGFYTSNVILKGVLENPTTFEDIRGIIRTAILQQDMATYYEDGGVKPTDLARTTTDSILGLIKKRANDNI
jgi:hypothetical protein